MTIASNMTGDDGRWMHRALRLAWRGRGRVEPNPMVGCVLVRDGKLLGEGWHRRFGGAHAEVEALSDCARRGHDPAGATAYVTLEPCAHHGKTPPCIEALIEARVARVVIAMEDPFAEVSGRGAAALREVAIEVRVGVGETEARRLNAAYLKRLSTGRPWVIAKWAQTLDGRIAAAGGDSQWISNSASRRQVHKLRGRVDAIFVGIGTVLSDDPMLTARDVPVRRVARRVVVDPQLTIPEGCSLLTSGTGDIVSPPVTLAIGSAASREKAEHRAHLETKGVEVVTLPPLAERPNRLDLRPLFEHLVRKYQATNVLVEGGASLLGACFAQELVNEALVFIAPKLLADAHAVPVARGLSRSRITDATGLTLRRLRRLGDDLMLDYLVREGDGRARVTA